MAQTLQRSNIIDGLIADLRQLYTEPVTANIGIGVTTHNRPAVFNKTIEHLIKYRPANARIVVVDDHSTEPVKPSGDCEVFRLPTNSGIATAKNKCFELLEDCEHIFLFDDDTYPIQEDWHVPYTSSGYNHLMYIFDKFASGQPCGDMQTLYSDNTITAYTHVRGCMLYYRRICLQTVGGMDTRFGKWGHEHGDLSNRIFSAGLTPFRYMDVVNSKELFYASDEHQSVTSTFPGNQRAKALLDSEKYYNDQYNKATYHPYKGLDKTPIILTCFFTDSVDPQRGNNWKTEDLTAIEPLIESVKKRHLHLKVIDSYEFTGKLNPYFKRWFAYYDYLVRNRDAYSWVFCVDATDVELLFYPEPIPGKIYVGDEPTHVLNDWLVQNHPRTNSFYNTLYNRYPSNQLMNAGILGGYVEDVMQFLRHLIDRYAAMVQGRMNTGMTDMALFNSICYDSPVADKIISGGKVNTEFKANRRNYYSWFKHK